MSRTEQSFPLRGRLWIPAELHVAYTEACNAVEAAISLLREAKNDSDSTPEELAARARKLLQVFSHSRKTIFPLVDLLVQAHHRTGDALPTLEDVEDTSALGWAVSFADAALNAYCEQDTSATRGGTFYPNVPIDRSAMDRARKRLRLFTIPNARTMERLLDREVRAASEILKESTNKARTQESKENAVSSTPRMPTTEQSEETVEDDESELTARQRDILETMLEQEITSERRLKNRAAVVLLINRKHKHQSYNSDFADLVKRGFAQSREGRCGGVWLTLAGRAAAKRLRQSN